MTVESKLTKKIFLGNGAATEFSVPFAYSRTTDLYLLHTDASGTDALVVSNFRVNVSTTGDTSVTYPVSGSPLPVGEKLTIFRATPQTQIIDLIHGGNFNPDVLEHDGFDRVVMMLQEVDEKASRAIKLPISSTEDSTQIMQDIFDAAKTAEQAAQTATEEADRAAAEADQGLSAIEQAKNDVIQEITEQFDLNAFERIENKGVASGYAPLDDAGKIPPAYIPDDIVGGVIGHGELAGLGNDDHKQYLLRTDHTKAMHDAMGINADTLDGQHASEFAAVDHNHTHTNLLGLGGNDHPQYLLVTAHTKAVHDAMNINAATVGGQAASAFAPAAQGVTNGNAHDHNGGDGAQIDHGSLGGRGDDDHPQYIRHALATAENDFLVASAEGPFVKKTLAETKTILGVGSGMPPGWSYGSAAPTTGSHSVGEVVLLVDPVAGGAIGFICVAAGTPGTWKPWGGISL